MSVDIPLLSLGCGDMRSCMFTIYKHFGFDDNSTINGPKGVLFVLNDRSASLLARNILFLYLCLRMPSTNADTPIQLKWIASMWSIWYNHELQPEHTLMLTSALQELDTWSSTQQKWSQCPLGAVVLFSSPAAFATVKKVWANWNAHYMEKSVNEMTRERNVFQCHHMTKTKFKYTDRVDGLTKIATNDFVVNSIQHSSHSSETILKMTDEHIHYLTTGSVWAETVLGIPLSGNKTTVNPTFYERKDGMYSLHYTLTPYMGYTKSFHYTNAAVCETMGSESPILQLLMVDDHNFQFLPLLANSVQQFAMWLIATSRGIQSSKKNLSFLIDLGDSIDFCYRLTISPSQSKLRFDVITTSNLFDHLSPTALVLTCLPLLKDNGTLFTATFKIPISGHWEYLEQMFGFSPEYFPAFLGICCIGQDGRYSSAISPIPCPTMYQTLSRFVVFPWRYVNSQPLVLDSIGECPHAVQFLLDLCKTSCIQGNTYVGSPESFLCVLHQFLRAQPSSEYFIRALGAAIKNEPSLKPHLIQLQTQSLLHGVHIHIILTEEDCPLCLQQPLENYIQQYSLVIEIDSCKIDLDETPTFTLYLSSFSGDIATMSSFAAVNHNDSALELIFHLPKYCCSQYSLINLCAFQISGKKDIFFGTVRSLKKSSVKFLFLKHLPKASVHQILQQKSSLGEIIKHSIGDCCTFETTITMSSMCQKALSEAKMKTICNKSNQLELYCGALKSTILYPYAIDESKTHIKISKKRKTIFINVQRADSVLLEDARIFYIDPSNKLVLPRFKCTPAKMESFYNMQIPFNPEENHPLNNAKSSFAVLFTHALNGEKYFTLSFKFVGILDIHALVYVHDLRFSPVCASPALDVSYCFLDTKPSNLLSRFEDLHSGLGSKKNIVVDDAEYKLLKEIFKYYSDISCCAFSTDRHTVNLPVQKHKLWKYFDHAILFPLYPNPANPNFQKISRFMHTRTRSITNPLQLGGGTGNVCAFCQIAESTTVLLKNCSICQSEKYCSEECQHMHKRFHEPSCKPSETHTNRGAKPETTTSLPKAHSDFQLFSDAKQLNTHSSKSPSSNNKEMPHDELNKDSSAADVDVNIHVCMRCKRPATIVCQCKTVSYCSKACQTLEWPEHSEKYHQHSSTKPTHYSTQSHKLIPERKHSQDRFIPTASDNSRCSNCGKCKESLKQCSRCHKVSYCSVECQRLDWPQHKACCIVAGK